jgi:hypothetical protein
VTDQQEDSESSTPAPFDVAVERTRKALARNPQINANDLFVRFLEPLLAELRAEYSVQLDEIEETLDTLDLPDEDVLEQAKQLILMLGNLVDNTFSRIGWTNSQGATDQMPFDVRQAFQQATVETRAFFERLVELEEEDDEEDEDDEGDEEGEEEGDAA